MSTRTKAMLRLTVAAGSVLLLAACGSSNDQKLEERLTRAEEAAKRAEAAQARAETAARKAVIFSSHSPGGDSPVMDAPPPDDSAADQSEPDTAMNEPEPDNVNG